MSLLLGKMIEFTNGKKAFLLGGYTYGRHISIRKGSASRWVCTLNNRCNAYIHLDHDLRVILDPRIRHTHAPPNIYKLKTGEYVKLQ